MTKFGWCLVLGITPHRNCRREFTYGSRTYRCSCPCHAENDQTLKELI